MTENASIVALDPLALLSRDRALAERALNRLPMAEQLRSVLAAPLDRREALLLLSHHAKQLVQAMPAEELWLTIKSMDSGEAIDLIRAAKPTQLQFCFDVDVWRKDAWEPQPTLRWLTVIQQCGEAKVVEWWENVDPELLVHLMKRWVTVYMRTGDEDVADVIPWPRDEAPFTLDNMYYYQCNDADVDRILRPMMEALARHDLPRLRHIFDATIGAVGAEQEEAAYEIRERRLAEFGFPPWEEAVAVYARVPQSRWESLRRTADRPADDETPPVDVAPQFSLMGSNDGDLFFKTVLDAIDDPAIVGRTLLEMSRLTNRIVIADGHMITPATVLQAATKAMGYANIGLELVSRSDPVAGMKALHEYWAVALFQIGYSAVMEVAERARATWAKVAPTAIPDDPVVACPYERVQAAAWKWPKYYIGPEGIDGVSHRDFRSVADLASVQAALAILE